MSDELGADDLNADLTGDLMSDSADGDALADDIFSDSLATADDDAASADPADTDPAATDATATDDEPVAVNQTDNAEFNPLGTGGDEVEADGNWHVDVNLDGQQFDGGIATIDADGDGLDDTSVANVVNEEGQLESTYYIDESGDGIADQVLTTDADGNVTEFQQFDAETGEFVEAEFTGEIGEEGPQVADTAGQPQTLPAEDTADPATDQDPAATDDAAQPTPVDPTDGGVPTDETTVPTDETEVPAPTDEAEGDTSVGTPVGDAYIADNSIGEAPDAEEMTDFQEDIDAGMVNTDVASAGEEAYDLNADGVDDAAYSSNDDKMVGYMAIDNDGDGQADQIVATNLMMGEGTLTDDIQANYVMNPDTGAWENVPVQGQG